MLLSYRYDVTPAKSAGVGFGSRARSIAVTLTYLCIAMQVQAIGMYGAAQPDFFKSETT